MYIIKKICFLLYIYNVYSYSISMPFLKKNIAIISNINTNNLNTIDKKDLLNLFDTIPILIFKNQKLKPIEYYNFVKIFDKNYNNISMHFNKNTRIPYIEQIGLIKECNNDIIDIFTPLERDLLYDNIQNNYLWRQDISSHNKYLPTVVSSFYMLNIPDNNDYIHFINYEDVYDIINMNLKKKIKKLNTINTNYNNLMLNDIYDYNGLKINKPNDKDLINISTRPLIIFSNKYKKKKTLLLNPKRFLKFDKYNFDDSNDLFRHIMIKYVLREDNFISHKWENNDICIFNNRKLLYTFSPFINNNKKKRIYMECILGTNEPIIKLDSK